MDFCYKYKKYKRKYLDLKQKGGSIVYDPLICGNSLLKQSIEDGKLVYYKVPGKGNDFTREQKNDIEVFVNFILPHFKLDTGQTIGTDAIKYLEVMGAGTFGVTVYYKHILMKILKLNFENIDIIANEINAVSYLFFDTNGNPKSVPEQLNKVIGYLTSNRELNNKILYKKINPEFDKYSLYMNLPPNNLDLHDVYHSVENIIPQENFKLMKGNIAVMFLVKEDMDLIEYMEIFDRLSSQNKYTVSKKYWQDMYIALHYLNFQEKTIHGDIKLENIVVKFNSLQNNLDITFKLIDFGVLRKIDNINDVIQHRAGTPVYYGDVFEYNTSVVYDWYCTLIAYLLMTKFLTIRNGEVILEYDNTIYNFHDTENFSIIERALKKFFAQGDKLIKLLLRVYYLIYFMPTAGDKLNNYITIENKHYTLTDWINLIHNDINAL